MSAPDILTGLVARADFGGDTFVLQALSEAEGSGYEVLAVERRTGAVVAEKRCETVREAQVLFSEATGGVVVPWSAFEGAHG